MPQNKRKKTTTTTTTVEKEVRFSVEPYDLMCCILEDEDLPPELADPYSPSSVTLRVKLKGSKETLTSSEFADGPVKVGDWMCEWNMPYELEIVVKHGAKVDTEQIHKEVE